MRLRRAANRSIPSSVAVNAGSATPGTAASVISARVTRASRSSTARHVPAPCRRPTSKSAKSCAGVILTAPVPFSGSEYASATTGMRRPVSGTIDVAAHQRCVPRILRVDGDRRVAQASSPAAWSPRSATGPCPRRGSGYARSCPSPPASRPRGRRSRTGTSDPSSPGGGRGRSAPARYSVTNTSRTASDSPASMVNRSRSQSSEAPSRRSCWLIPPPDSAFHSHTRSDERLPPDRPPRWCRRRRAGAPPPSGWRSPRGRCPAATTRPAPACGASGSACPAGSWSARGRHAGCPSHWEAGS